MIFAALPAALANLGAARMIGNAGSPMEAAVEDGGPSCVLINLAVPGTAPATPRSTLRPFWGFSAGGGGAPPLVDLSAPGSNQGFVSLSSLSQGVPHMSAFLTQLPTLGVGVESAGAAEAEAEEDHNANVAAAAASFVLLGADAVAVRAPGETCFSQLAPFNISMEVGAEPVSYFILEFWGGGCHGPEPQSCSQDLLLLGSPCTTAGEPGLFFNIGRYGINPPLQGSPQRDLLDKAGDGWGGATCARRLSS